MREECFADKIRLYKQIKAIFKNRMQANPSYKTKWVVVLQHTNQFPSGLGFGRGFKWCAQALMAGQNFAYQSALVYI